MKYKEILSSIEVAPCSRCGGKRDVTWFSKLLIYIAIFNLRRKGLDDTHIIVYLNNLMDKMCISF